MKNALTISLAAIFSLAALTGCGTTKKKSCPSTGACCPTSATSK
jgi:hypothetical protein